MIWHPDIPLEYRNQIVTGDARELTKRIPDESIDLIFTDPVYDRIEDYEWLAREGKRILKTDGSLLVYCAIGLIPHTHSALSNYLNYRWRFVTRNVNSKEFFGKLLICSKECLWYSVERTQPYKSIFDVELSTKKGNYVVDGANWGKGTDVPLRYINSFSLEDGIVLDPFCGSGTFPSLCKILGRNYIAFEIDSDTAELARERVRNTQPPLFVLEPEQLELKETNRLE